MIGKALIIECIALSLAAGSREKILKKNLKVERRLSMINCSSLGLGSIFTFSSRSLEFIAYPLQRLQPAPKSLGTGIFIG